MLISKFNLYKTEWLDLVFEDRNKDYGAYYLRQHYAGNVVKAMVITFLSIGALCGASLVFYNVKPVFHIINLDNHPQVLLPPVKAIKKIEPPAAPKHLKSEQVVKPVQTIKNIPPVVTVDNKAEKPVKTTDLEHKASGQTTSLTGKEGTSLDLPIDKGNTGDGPVDVPDNSVHNTIGLDFMPEPVGGNAAWSKFLSKNLRFPPVAQEDGASGRVYVSFIIEKDGTLSNITVDKAAGHGFDEEALRVLKLAKAWKPGMQNGQPVRVKYTIPINFQAAEQ